MNLSAPWGLAWVILALAAFGWPIDTLQQTLASLPDLQTVEDTSTLALVLLAIDHERALLDLGVNL